MPSFLARALPLVGALLLSLARPATAHGREGVREGSLPSYHYVAPIAVECMNRSM